MSDHPRRHRVHSELDPVIGDRVIGHGDDSRDDGSLVVGEAARQRVQVGGRAAMVQRGEQDAALEHELASGTGDAPRAAPATVRSRTGSIAPGCRAPRRGPGSAGRGKPAQWASPVSVGSLGQRHIEGTLHGAARIVQHRGKDGAVRPVGRPGVADTAARPRTPGPHPAARAIASGRPPFWSGRTPAPTRRAQPPPETSRARTSTHRSEKPRLAGTRAAAAEAGAAPRSERQWGSRRLGHALAAAVRQQTIATGDRWATASRSG